jgi:hypothetical protein
VSRKREKRGGMRRRHAVEREKMLEKRGGTGG